MNAAVLGGRPATSAALKESRLEHYRVYIAISISHIERVSMDILRQLHQLRLATLAVPRCAGVSRSDQG